MWCPMSERQLQTRVLQYLNKLENCRAYNMHGSAWTGAGRPDIVGCFCGFMFVIELKRPGEIPSKIQEYELCKWRHAGAIAWYATTLEDVQEMIEHMAQVVIHRKKK